MSTAFLNVLSKHPSKITKDEALSLYNGMPENYKKEVTQDSFVNYFSQPGKRENIFWHDYEAGGTNAMKTQPLQFASIRTDLDHNVIDVPLDLYCKPAGDKLPHPVAIALTKISPLHCEEKGLPEPLFFRNINAEMSAPGSCTTGHNSMGYDETITRFGFWRNFIPVYKREFLNGNSRWDTLGLLAVFSALDIPGINWPKREDDQSLRSLKLENFAKSNGITQDNAHNAVDDVKAMIDVSKFLKEKSKSLWEYLYKNRTKKEVSSIIAKEKVGILVSPFFGGKKNFHSPVMLLGQVPGDKNKWAYIELSDIEQLKRCQSLTVDELKTQLYMSKDELAEGGLERPPIGSFAINKAPAFIPLDWIMKNKPDIWSEEYSALYEKVSSRMKFIAKILSVLERSDDDDDSNGVVDVELELYSSGFASKNDESGIQRLCSRKLNSAFSEPQTWDLPGYSLMWQSARCKLDGYDGVLLNEQERIDWYAHCLEKLVAPIDPNSKHEEVNFDNVDEVLKETEMSEQLRMDYRVWLVNLKERMIKVLDLGL